MARLESTAKAGYFPTPPRIASAIGRHLASGPGGSKHVIRLLDPCAGTGEAAAILAQHLSAESFGIELNADRAAAAQSHLDHVLATSAFSVRLAHGAFGCLFLNPPYAEDEEKRRLEHAFLVSMTRALCPGGVLVFLVPQRRLAVSARYLASHYTGFEVYRFPDPEFVAFQQVVLFARRKPQPSLDVATQRQLEAWSETVLTPLPDEPLDGPCIVVPALPTGDVLFASLFFDPAQAAAEARRRGVWVQPQLAEQLWPSAEQPVQPLMPLRKGHLALLIAAGMLNNVVLSQAEQRVLVKGRTYKVLLPVETDDDHTEITREVLRTSVMVLDLTTGILDRVDQGEGQSHGDKGQAS
jgi:SAM-dependent methyltransferase